MTSSDPDINAIHAWKAGNQLSVYAKDITGQEFGYLLAIDPVGLTKNHQMKWLFKCKCGQQCVRIASNVIESHKRGHIPSCFCRLREKRSTNPLSNRHHSCYSVWNGMRQRVREHDKNHKYYWDKGIKVCERWKQFSNFLSDMGERPSSDMTIDRIDTDGDYEPNNCRWATRLQQLRNASSNVRICFKGQTKCVSEWSKEVGIASKTIRARLKYGWNPIHAITIPVGHRSYRSIIQLR